MKKSALKIGGLYRSKVNGVLTTVRLDRITEGSMGTTYYVTNMRTKRTTAFRSPIKFLEEVRQGVKIVPVKDGPNDPSDRTFNEADDASRKEEAELREDEHRSDPTALDVLVAPATSTVLEGSSSMTPIQSAPIGRLAAKLAEKAKERSSGPAHVEVQALAGTGKTTTNIEGLKALRGLPTSIKPSPQQMAVWEQLRIGKSDSIRMSAFNTSITNEMKTKLDACGLSSKGVEAKGIHGLGNQAVYKAFGRQEPTGTEAMMDHVCDLLGGNIYDLRTKPGMLTSMNAVVALVGYCKQGLLEPTRENLDELVDHHTMDIDNRSMLYELVPQVLEKSKDPKGKIAFDDQIWLPLVLNLPIPKVDVQIIDESQDLNRMQQELMYLGGRRIVFVGDMHQAIYGFAGADAESMIRMRKTLGDTTQGIVTLPLTVTRRCAKTIVAEAKHYVPEYTAHESNPLGRIDRARYPIQGIGDDRRELPWDQTYGPLVKDGAMVLCRCNAPLVSQCFRFLKRGIRASIMGKKIGEGLVRLVEKSKASSIPDLFRWLSDWKDKEDIKEAAKKFPSESKMEAIRDRFDCVMAFTEGCVNSNDVIRKINEVFTDQGKGLQGIRFSSIHKSKGLEARQVFILRPPGVGPRTDKMKPWELEQESNLSYVAITRAIEELVYVS